MRTAAAFAFLLASCTSVLIPRVSHEPATDEDGDRLAGSDDRCPDRAEDADGYHDRDGCPETDNDHDGVADASDRCPCTAEDLDGFEDGDGCADLDDDGDRIADACDACPRESEVYDGCSDEDGCPDALVAVAGATAVSTCAAHGSVSPCANGPPEGPVDVCAEARAREEAEDD